MFGGMAHSNRTERNKGAPITDGMRSGAPSVVYRGVQSLRNIMDDAMSTAILSMNSYNTYGDYKNSSLHGEKNELVDAPCANIGSYNIDRICGNDYIFSINLKNLRDRASVFIFTLN